MQTSISFQQRLLRNFLQSRGVSFSQRASHQLSHPSRRLPVSRRASANLYSTSTRPIRPNKSFQSAPFRPWRSFRRFQSTQTPVTPEKLSISQRFKKLSREYGWSAVGVYFSLSVLDFPFCFLAVRMLGTDRIGHWEHVILSYVKATVKWPLPAQGQEMIDGMVGEAKDVVTENVSLPGAEEGEMRILEEGETYSVEDHGYHEAVKANSGEDASIWTQLALAYAIHKSFIFVRVPLTAAITPKVVKTLRSWGWNIGKRPSKRIASSGTGSGVNTGNSGIKPNN